MKIYPEIHISLLELVANDTYPGKVQSPPPIMVLDEEEEYEVEEILNSCIRWKMLEYLFK